MLKKCFTIGLVWALTVHAALASIPQTVEDMLRASNMPDTALGVMVYRVSDGKVIWSHNATQPMQPASTMKVLTAIVGLETLGPAYRARTVLTSPGRIINGVLEGDLNLRGEGNADITWEDLQRMLRDLRHQGVREIRGNVLVDRTFFQPARLDVGVPPFDESPEFRYNVIPDALLINMNLAQFDISSSGNSLEVRLTPALDGVKVISNMSLVQRACEKWEDGWKIPTTVYASADEVRVYLEGEFPANCAISTNLNVIDRAEFTARLVRQLWRDLGGVFTGQVIERTAPAERAASAVAEKVLAEHRSRPLAEVTRNINKVSDNTITRMILLTLGTRTPKLNSAASPITANAESSSTLANGERMVRRWLKDRSIDDTGLVLENGSGLSRLERISAAQLAGILAAAYRSKWAPEFLSSLPIVAVDGSMRSRLKDSPAAETARIKTGSLRNVVSVAGFVTNAAGEAHVVVGMVNDDRAIRAGGRAMLDALLDFVARSGTAAAVAK
jgi:D-alanyl-D-alanine carboxypeptidase/D-alanyl-D-alanine-endopeptidase (penicillin-binding protein 4)